MHTIHEHAGSNQDRMLRLNSRSSNTVNNTGSHLKQTLQRNSSDSPEIVCQPDPRRLSTIPSDLETNKDEFVLVSRGINVDDVDLYGITKDDIEVRHSMDPSGQSTSKQSSLHIPHFHQETESGLSIVMSGMPHEREDTFNTMDSDRYSPIQVLETRESIQRNIASRLGREIGDKTTDDLKVESEFPNDLCISNQCGPMKRITIVLDAYHRMMRNDELWRKVSLKPIIQLDDRYAIGQITNDWHHIRLHHIKESEMNRRTMNDYFGEMYPCHDLTRCRGINKQKHVVTDSEIRDAISSQNPEELETEDKVFQTEMDKIHVYLLHNNQEIAEQRETEKANEEAINAFATNHEDANAPTLGVPEVTILGNEVGTQRSVDVGYIGTKDDREWYAHAEDPIQRRPSEDRLPRSKSLYQDDGTLYHRLRAAMGTYQWQDAHGFSSSQHHGLRHIKPRRQNIKDEALNNPYHELSTDNWNQTMRKSETFFNSFARKQIRSPSDGRFEDQVMRINVSWFRGVDIDMEELFAMKLYTDFDKLQHELKKCFRREWTIESSAQKREDERFELEYRLSVFFHWRLKLLTVLHKFGKNLDGGKVLYFGVNQKMVVQANCLRFFGPLSTSPSPHVARTFATAKGVIFKIANQFPRYSQVVPFRMSKNVCRDRFVLFFQRNADSYQIIMC